MKEVKKVIKILLIFVLVLFLACLASVWLSYNYLTVSYFNVQSSKISEPFRLVLISDLHEHHFGNGNEKLAEKIREQSPDIIIIDGDMINGNSGNADTAVEVVQILKDIAPVYYSLGNHEYDYMEAGHEELPEELEAAGAQVLNYESVDIEVNGNVFCQVLFPEKSVGIPFFQQGIFPAFSGHYASLRMRACSIR